MSASSFEKAARATALAAAIAEESLHSADPGDTGANETTAARQPVAATAAGGVVSIPAASFTGGAASGAADFIGLWDGSGNFLYATPAGASGDSAFNAAGDADVDAWTLTDNG